MKSFSDQFRKFSLKKNGDSDPQKWLREEEKTRNKHENHLSKNKSLIFHLFEIISKNNCKLKEKSIEIPQLVEPFPCFHYHSSFCAHSPICTCKLLLSFVRVFRSEEITWFPRFWVKNQIFDFYCTFPFQEYHFPSIWL